MEVDHVSGSEPDEEDWWENVDEVRRRSTRYSWEMMGHFARDCKRTGKGEKGGDRSKGYAKGEGKTTEGAGKKGPHKGGPSGESKSWRYQGQVDVPWKWTRADSVSTESRCHRGGKMTTAEEVEHEEEEEGTGHPGCPFEYLGR